jgi:uncharacterized protein with FMN-binding domain
MIRTTAVPRSVRVGAAVVGVAGTIALAGCSTTGSSSADDNGTTSGTASGADGTYSDGTYTAEGTYATPESVETISVTVTLADDVVTAVKVNGTPTERESKEYQSKFIGGISDAVVGKDIDTISVSRVAGSSLTSSGFNQAIEEIKSQAAA